MLTKERFYSEYDSIAPLIFRNYYGLLDTGSRTLPHDVESVSDLGIGSGNFSSAVRKRFPSIKIYGIDINEDLLRIAKQKVSGLTAYNYDIFSETLPKTDYVISSFMMHHLDREIRNDLLSVVLNSARRGFVNVDIALFNGKGIESILEKVLSFASESFSDREGLEKIEYEIRANDNPVSVEQDREFFQSLGMDFQILKEEDPYVVYSAFWPERKS